MLHRRAFLLSLPAISMISQTAFAQNIPAPVERLQRAFEQMVQPQWRPPALRVEEMIQAAKGEMQKASIVLDRGQTLVWVDRRPLVQEIAILYADPTGPWHLIGASKTSTGQPQRRGHFISPTGVFDHNGDILGWRAEGTRNGNGIRGYGAKGRRIWDFGWRPAQAGWKTQSDIRDIRFLMHATDPDRLEARLGHPASEGCIRVSGAFNHFVDFYGLLDRAAEEKAKSDPRFAALLLRDRQASEVAGQYLVVSDPSAS